MLRWGSSLSTPSSGAVVYAHAFLDIGARIGLFDAGKDSRLLTAD